MSAPNKAKRIPRDAGHPVEPHLLAKQIELDADPNAIHMYFLADQLGAELVAQGILSAYLVKQAQDFLDMIHVHTPAYLAKCSE